MTGIFDSSALLALLRDEAGADVVDSLLSDRANVCLAHAVNLCEVYYDIARALDEAQARAAIQRLLLAGIGVREDMDTAFWQEAGRIKAQYRRVSLADCFCITLARRVNAEV